MAETFLQEVEPPAGARLGERWYLLTADVFGGPIFEGPVDAVGFSVCDDAMATYQWRSAVDLVHARAVAVAQGHIGLDAARRVPAFAAYLDDKVGEQRLAAACANDVEWAGDTDEALALRVCAQITGGTRDLHADGEVYCIEDDRWLGDAACALAQVVPGWARVVTLDAGGPGSGYEQPFVVLDTDHTLGDLERWINREKGDDQNQRG